jgi:hypothetical protein
VESLGQGVRVRVFRAAGKFSRTGFGLWVSTRGWLRMRMALVYVSKGVFARWEVLR